MKKRLAKLLPVMLLMVFLMAFEAYADDSANPTKLSIDGGVVSDKFEASYNSQYKYYELDVTDAGKLSFTVSCTEKIEIELFKGSMDSDNHTSLYIEKGDATRSIELLPDKYILQVGDHSGKGAGFNIETAFSKANETYTGDDDTINLIRNGDALPFDAAITGQLAWKDSLDYYKITLPSSGLLTINVHSNFETLSSELYKEENETVTSFDDMGIGDQVFDIDLKAGTYYLCFKNGSDPIFGGPGTGTGVYNFTLGFIPSGETYTSSNDSINLVRNSEGIPFGKTIAGQLAYREDSDYYKVVVPAYGDYTLSVNSNLNKITVSFYDANDNYAGSSYHDKGSKTYTYKMKAGTYYLRFEQSSGGDTGNYTFKFSMSVPKPAIKSISGIKKGFTVKWNKKAGVSGYQIMYTLKGKSNGKKVTIKRASASKKTIKGLKSNKKYVVRIRSYKTVKGRRYYSAWSTKKSIRTK